MGILLLVGVVVVGAAPDGARGAGLAGTHLVAALAALALYGATARAVPARLLRHAPLAYGASLLATAAVFLPGLGQPSGGARRRLVVAGLALEPAPLLVVATVLLCARLVTDEAEPGRRHVLRVLPVLTLACAPLALEPDFSSVGILLVASVATLLGAGTPPARAAALASPLVAGAFVAAARRPYVAGRVRAFLDPAAHRLGRAFEPLRLQEALAALTPGGLGLGHAPGRFNLSSPHADYVFTILLVELGALGALLVLVPLGLLVVGGVRAAGTTPGPVRALCLGLTTALVAGAGLHVLTCTGRAPISTTALPFVSHAPTDLAAAAIAAGLLAAAARAGR